MQGWLVIGAIAVAAFVTLLVIGMLDLDQTPQEAIERDVREQS